MAVLQDASRRLHGGVDRAPDPEGMCRQTNQFSAAGDADADVPLWHEAWTPQRPLQEFLRVFEPGTKGAPSHGAVGKAQQTKLEKRIALFPWPHCATEVMSRFEFEVTTTLATLRQATGPGPQ